MATVSRVVCAALVALLALLAVAGASTLTLFDGNFDAGCVGNLEVISCGACRSINSTMQGGYYFSYTQGICVFYSSDDCSGSAAEVLTDDVWSCSRFTYGSAFVACSSSPWDITARP